MLGLQLNSHFLAYYRYGSTTNRNCLRFGSGMLVFSAMAKSDIPASRRRAKLGLGKKTLVYFSDAERKTIDRAAKLERRSISSFIANAAILAANRLLQRDRDKQS